MANICIQHFQMYFLEWKSLQLDSVFQEVYIPKGPIYG